jgi:hypothetical protein
MSKKKHSVEVNTDQHKQSVSETASTGHESKSGSSESN